jgi:uncharacterized membrane protein YgcG
MDVVSLFAQRFHGLRFATGLAVAVVAHAETMAEVGTIAAEDTTTDVHPGIMEEKITIVVTMTVAIMIAAIMTAAIMTAVIMTAETGMMIVTDMMVGKYITVCVE